MARSLKRPSHLFSTLLAIASLLDPSRALFGIGEKRFKYEGLIHAGSLGLDQLQGQVVALGDYNGDQYQDLLVLDPSRSKVDVLLWDHSSFRFQTEPAASISAPDGFRITNVVAADLNYDGKLDVLAMGQRNPMHQDPSEELQMLVWLSSPDGGFNSQPFRVPSSTLSQPVAFDASGDMQMDLLAHEYPSSGGVVGKLKLWKNLMSPGFNATTSDAFQVMDAPLLAGSDGRDESCQLANPHSSSYIDLNGDCLADLFLVCSTPKSDVQTFQIWVTSKGSPSGFVLSRTGTLPPGSGALSFADMDRDGTIDVVFPSCEPSSGVCYINIAYNKQVPLCSQKSEGLFGGSPLTPREGDGKKDGKLVCRDSQNLCEADDEYVFDFTVSDSNKNLFRVPISSLTEDGVILLTDTSMVPSLPVSLQLGDFNKDGYPDIAVITLPKGGKKDATRVHLLQNVACSSAGSGPGCSRDSDDSQRTLVRLVDGAVVLDNYKDVRSVNFFDVDEDGTLDLLLQRLPASGDPSASRLVTFVQNNFFHDAFFLKSMTLNGACQSFCEASTASGRKSKFRPWGVNYGGASYKFTVLDTNGVRRAQQVGQLPQVNYRSLLTPYSYFGLGRTNNYVESLFVGSTRHQKDHFLTAEGIIPNSQVFINPYQGGAGSKGGDPGMWSKQLYLHPGDWIPWVTIVLITIIVALAGLVAGLHINERREDERERKRAVHAINFDAL